MAVRYDARAGRMVRETDEERIRREYEAAQARGAQDAFETSQSRWDRMRTLSRDEQRAQNAYRQRQEDARLQTPPPPAPPKPSASSTSSSSSRAATQNAQNVALRRAGVRAATGFEELARGGSEEA